jgi:hypothetical protein
VDVPYLKPCYAVLHNVYAEAVAVTLEQTAAGAWQLTRNGEPYFIQGAGGNASKELLAEAGANCFRTWGVGPELGQQLDVAEELGLTVVVGHWLGHERHGFSYSDQAALDAQKERIRRDVLQYKDHPAVLLWAIGNEMEGFDAGDNPAIWNHVQELAAMIKEIDPLHPTLTVTADIGGKRVESVYALCPDIDIMGINSYGGAASLPQRYRALGGRKPYIITEFGPPGVWEVPFTPFGAPLELTSTAKAAHYRRAYMQGCLAEPELCLGSFAFTWGSKIEGTASWYGMFLPSGEKLAAVDIMTELWSGALPANLCPQIIGFSLQDSTALEVDKPIFAKLDARDPEGEKLHVNWQVRKEVENYNTGGDAQQLPLQLDGVIHSATDNSAELLFPGGGVFRLYVTVSDGSGGAATANIPLKIAGESGCVQYKMPVVVYGDDATMPWTPSGWMGNHAGFTMNQISTEMPHSGKTCLEFHYAAASTWVGVAWQHPASDWGEQEGGYNLTGAKKLTFWARGKFGGEVISYGLGLLDEDRPYHDSVRIAPESITLKPSWKRYVIHLRGTDLSRIKTPFYFTMSGDRKSTTFYLDDIQFE